MKLRTTVIAAAAGLALAGSFGTPVVNAHARSIIEISKISLKMIVPDKVSSEGAYTLNLLMTGAGFASFDLYERISNISKKFNKVETANGCCANVLLQPDSAGEITFYAVPHNGADGMGGTGANSPDSASFYPYALSSSNWSSPSSDATTISSDKYFSGSALQTSNVGDYASPETCSDYNDGFIIGTGPKGGIGQVQLWNGSAYVNVPHGTIDFYSAKVTGFNIEFKYGTGVATHNLFRVVETGPGAGGGNDMWFTGIAVASACKS